MKSLRELLLRFLFFLSEEEEGQVERLNGSVDSFDERQVL